MNCDVQCTINCKTCGYENNHESRYHLQFKSAPVQDFIRNFNPIENPTISETAKCWTCKEPHDADINSIKSICMDSDDDYVTINFDCKSCKRETWDQISVNSELIQKFLIGLN